MSSVYVIGRKHIP